ncbi:hypothetical protein EU519_00070 [Candidatus Thorarchaeota archaeon]|nr:MAG: hypothetical protein EU519_00070 [Candidatus Thorarchaeota archaeon]
MDALDRLSGRLHGLDGRVLEAELMKTLRELIREHTHSADGVTGVDRLRSKKNVVLRLALSSGEKLIGKLFVTGQFELEHGLLVSCRTAGLSVPEVYGARNGVILMQYISGEPLVDALNRTLENRYVVLLAQWYYDFHQTTDMLKGDPRLRNFIVADDTLWGLDFEEAHEGPWILDIGGVTASILDTNPIFSREKRRMAWLLLDEYLGLIGKPRTKTIEEQFLSSIADALAETAMWREDDRIKSLSEQVRQEGISCS